MRMVLLIVDTSVRLAWIMYMVSLTSRLSICGAYLLRVGSILTCPDSSWASTCSSCTTTWLIDTNELVNKVIEALFIIPLWKLLVAVVVKILMQYLFEIFVQLLSTLIL